jgi:hypothetical protein
MDVLGIDEISYGADDLPACRQFFLDWGLSWRGSAAGWCSNAERLPRDRAASADPACRPPSKPAPRCARWSGAWKAKPTWQVRRPHRGSAGLCQDGKRVGCTDPNGLAVRLQVTASAMSMRMRRMNTWNARAASTSAARSTSAPAHRGRPRGVLRQGRAGLRALLCGELRLRASDRYPERGAFLRCADGGHHDIFLLQRPEASMRA